jgi:hypothetical protein
LYRYNVVDVKKVGDDEFEEKRYRRNMRKTEAVRKWARKKTDGHNMKGLLSHQESDVGVRDNPSHFLFGGGGRH